MAGIMFLNLRRVNMASSTSVSDMLNYYNRDEAVDKTNIDSMLNYYNREEAVQEIDGGFCDGKQKSNFQAESELKFYRPQQVYQGIISLKQTDAQNLGFETKADFARLTERYLDETSKIVGIHRKDLVWTGYFHTNKERHPHVHFFFFDKTKTEQPLFTKKQLKQSRAALGRNIISHVDKFIIRDEKLQDEINRVNNLLEEADLEKLIQKSIVARARLFTADASTKSLVKEMIATAKTIPVTGKCTYNVLKKYHPLAFFHIENCVNMILKDSQGYEEYKSVITDIEDLYRTLYGDEAKNNYMMNQDELFRAKVGNLVVNKLKDLDAVNIYHEHAEEKYEYVEKSLIVSMDRFFANVDYSMAVYLQEMMAYAKRSDKSESKKQKET